MIYPRSSGDLGIERHHKTLVPFHVMVVLASAQLRSQRGSLHLVVHQLLSCHSPHLSALPQKACRKREWLSHSISSTPGPFSDQPSPTYLWVPGGIVYYDREVWVIHPLWGKESKISLIWISGTEHNYREVGEAVSPKRRNIRQKSLKWLFLPHLLSFHSFVLWDSALKCHFCFNISLAIHSSELSLPHVSPSLAMSPPCTCCDYNTGRALGGGVDGREELYSFTLAEWSSVVLTVFLLGTSVVKNTSCLLFDSTFAWWHKGLIFL